MILIDLKRYKEALTAVNRALKFDPTNLQTHFNRGSLLIELHYYEEALLGFDKILESNPENAMALQGRGIALLRMERYNEALDACVSALALNPNNVPTHINRAITLMNLQRFKEATEAFEFALSINQNDSLAHTKYADSCFVHLNDLDRAIYHYEQAMKCEPVFLGCYHNAACCYHTKGVLGKADKMFKKSNTIRFKPWNLC